MPIESFRGPVLMSLQQAREAAPEIGGLGIREHERLIEAVRRDPDAAIKMMRKRLERAAYRLGADVPVVTKLIGCKHSRTACRPASH